MNMKTAQPPLPLQGTRRTQELNPHAVSGKQALPGEMTPLSSVAKGRGLKLPDGLSEPSGAEPMGHD